MILHYKFDRSNLSRPQAGFQTDKALVFDHRHSQQEQEEQEVSNATPEQKAAVGSFRSLQHSKPSSA